MLLERARAATKIESRLAELEAKIGDLLAVRYTNGTGRTAAYNGWIETEAGSKYLKLGTGSVPPVYIVDIVKGS